MDNFNDENEKQEEIINRLRKINDQEYAKTGKRKKYLTVTYGCQMNINDSQKLEDILEEIGYIKTSKEADADFILFNTCCVRENAEQRVYGNLGHLKARKKRQPNLIIALCGCMMQQDTVIEELQKSHQHVDIIFGTFNLHKLPELLEARLETGDPIIDIWEKHEDFVEYMPTSRRNQAQVSINIMQGCNNFCSYCIVPYVRGRERSRELEDIIAEAKHLVADGATEITLLGQNVNSYGQTLDKPVTFAQLVGEINKIKDLKRIRFLTPHPKDLSDDLIKTIAKCDKVCKHIHLPVQAGSTRVLKAMKRRYTKESYLDLVGRIKAQIPNVSITTDIIVGFPGETEEDFNDTIDIVEKVKFESAFTYIYSKRTGTPAAAMEDQVDRDLIQERFDRLLKTLDQVVLENMKKYEGKVFEVLVERQSKNNPGVLTGRTKYNTLVHFKGDSSLVGNYIDVKITEGKPYYTLGEIKQRL